VRQNKRVKNDKSATQLIVPLNISSSATWRAIRSGYFGPDEQHAGASDVRRALRTFVEVGAQTAANQQTSSNQRQTPRQPVSSISLVLILPPFR
jgi:hypothetical protein